MKCTFLQPNGSAAGVCPADTKQERTAWRVQEGNRRNVAWWHSAPPGQPGFQHCEPVTGVMHHRTIPTWVSQMTWLDQGIFFTFYKYTHLPLKLKSSVNNWAYVRTCYQNFWVLYTRERLLCLKWLANLCTPLREEQAEQVHLGRDRGFKQHLFIKIKSFVIVLFYFNFPDSPWVISLPFDLLQFHARVRNHIRSVQISACTLNRKYSTSLHIR